jgi:hypothetical protein
MPQPYLAAGSGIQQCGVHFKEEWEAEKVCQRKQKSLKGDVGFFLFETSAAGIVDSPLELHTLIIYGPSMLQGIFATKGVSRAQLICLC